MTYRLSLAERIALTHGFRTSSDKAVLLGLASFAHFELGTNAHPNIDTLRARVPDLTKRTVERCLVRLEADGWIEGIHQHRRPTNYRICVERLATSATMAKVVAHNDRVDRQNVGQSDKNLTDGLSDLTDSLSGLTDKMSVHPVLDLDLDPSAPPLSRRSVQTAQTDDDHEQAKIEADDAHPPTTRDADLRADRGADPVDAAGDGHRPGGDHPPASGPRVPLQQGPDLPSARRADESRPRVGPIQATLGPLDVSATRSTRSSNFEKLADVMRRALKDAQQRRSG
jgi:hypothetical protein